MVVEATTVPVEFEVRLTVTPDTPVPSLVDVIAPLRAPFVAGAEVVAVWFTHVEVLTFPFVSTVRVPISYVVSALSPVAL